MVHETLHPDQIRRIELVNDPSYDWDPLTQGDHLLLILAGLIIPLKRK